MAAYRLGIDVGGTFTDVVILGEDTGEVRHTKVITSRTDPASSVLEGVSRALREFAVDPQEIASILHGTTIATNALIERRGARTALITSRGMRDILEIGRQIRPSLFDWFADKPEPLVPRMWRFEMNERVNSKGEPLAAPTDEEIRAIVGRLKAEGIESLAICFLFSFLRPEHEERVAAAIRQEMPGLAVSISFQILPEYREYERTSTTVANAYLTPILSRYAGRLGDSLGQMGLSAKLHLLQSNGGVAPLESASERAITTALSGPAGGVTGASHLSASLGIRDLISMDMGGTSCDVCLIRDGLPSWTSEAPVAGLPVRVPMIAVEAIGAGGGSVIWVDSGGVLRVGPHSVGSDPGPACYGRGGQVPALTDAHAVLGTVLPDYFPQKGIQLDAGAAERALKSVADSLSMGVEDTAVGAIRIINHHIAQAVRGISVARGHDPRDFVLLAFGGAGPMHACFVADELGMRRIVLPFAAGVFSALGAALADFRYDYLRTLPKRMKALEVDEVRAAHGEMEASARERLTGLPVMAVRIDRSVDLRYIGQSFEITVSIDGDRYDKEEMLDRFHRLHDESYGFSDPNEPVELVNVRLTAFGETAKPPAASRPASDDASESVLGRRSIPSFEGGRPVEFTLHDRTRFRPGARISGPAIVTDPNSTAIILPGWRGEVDAQGSIQMER